MSPAVPAEVLMRANEANQKRWRWIVDHVYGRILDCGSGSAETWKQTGYPMKNVVCIDAACYSEVPNFVWGDIHHLPFQDKSFDTCVLSEVLEHCLDPDKVLNEAKRVCKNRLVITVPDEHHWDPAVQPFMSWEDHIKRGELELIRRIPQLRKDIAETRMKHHWHIRQFKEGEIKALIERNNLKIREFSRSGEELKPYSHYLAIAEV